MTIVSSGLLETYTPSVSTQAAQNLINQKVADNIESLRRFGIGIVDVTSLHSHTAITADNFTLYKKAGFISFYQFNSSTGNIDGVFDGATLAEGDQFLLVNKASTPSTNTVTLALGSYSLLGSSDTSIVLNSNSVYVYLVYIGSDKFIRITHNTDILEQNNTWSGTNDFASLTLGANGTTSGLEIGNSSSGAGLSFIDFHYGIGSSQDYNVRLLNNTNEGFLFSTATKNIFSIDNSNFGFNVNSIPVADNTYSSGASGKRWTEIWAANGTINTSDRNKKENIEETKLGLNFVLDLKPVSWKWKDEPSRQIEEITYKKTYDNKGKFKELVPEKNIKTIPEKKYKRLHHGFINQDIEDLLKEKNISTNDFSGFVLDKETGVRALRYDSFIAPMVKAIQEQNKMIQELKLEIEKLKNNV
ncbi:MAG: hypothetical protein QG673_1855 [Pseudomonadota bacterium]|nr:hypothetical protein [Pseudomonadota bacterium]